mmetsp:Transcript_26886/g.72951  ORF Transcript_26886/g.72951 Transcript_26886/m.72951 type:complete len:222 (+) Transcript_26886:1273-1938(+)
MTASLGTRTSSGRTPASKSSRSAVAWTTWSSRRASRDSSMKRRMLPSSARVRTRTGHLCLLRRSPLPLAHSLREGGALAIQGQSPVLQWWTASADRPLGRAPRCQAIGLHPGARGRRVGVGRNQGSMKTGVPPLPLGKPPSGTSGAATPLGRRGARRLVSGGARARARGSHGAIGMAAPPSSGSRSRRRPTRRGQRRRAGRKSRRTNRSSGVQSGCRGPRR